MSKHVATDWAIKMTQRQKDGDLEGDLKGDGLELEKALASNQRLQESNERAWIEAEQAVTAYEQVEKRVKECEALILEMMRVLDVLLEGDTTPSDVVQAARLYNRAEDLVGPLEEEG